jgi:hypothetical protein
MSQIDNDWLDAHPNMYVRIVSDEKNWSTKVEQDLPFEAVMVGNKESDEDIKNLQIGESI